MKITAKFENVPRENPVPTPRTGDGMSPAARNLALAYKLHELIDAGLVADQTAAATLLRLSQPRLTHLMSLTLLAPIIQEAILAGTATLGDKALRRLARIADWSEQIAAVPDLGKPKSKGQCTGRSSGGPYFLFEDHHNEVKP